MRFCRFIRDYLPRSIGEQNAPDYNAILQWTKWHQVSLGGVRIRCPAPPAPGCLLETRFYCVKDFVAASHIGTILRGAIGKLFKKMIYLEAGVGRSQIRGTLHKDDSNICGVLPL
jgi:hypothetical protein